MRLLIGVATYNRIEKLDRCLKSIFANKDVEFRIEVVADNNDTYTQAHMNYVWGGIDCKVQEGHNFVIGAWNRIVTENIDKDDWDGFIGLCDDVELKPDALKIIINNHLRHFPDGDGVCGFKQECPGHPEYTFKWFGQTLMGRKFIERYKEAGYKICCPDYYHFCQDEEMFNYANSLNKFFCCEDAVLNHYHPGFVKEEVDETHHVIRSGKASPKDFDFLQQFKREQADLLWGRDFKLLGGKNG